MSSFLRGFRKEHGIDDVDDPVVALDVGDHHLCSIDVEDTLVDSEVQFLATECFGGFSIKGIASGYVSGHNMKRQDIS